MALFLPQGGPFSCKAAHRRIYLERGHFKEVVSLKKISFRNLGLCLAGSLLISIATHCFTQPANIAPGGATGIALMLNHLTGAPVGAATLCINIPLLLLAWRHINTRFTLRTAATCLLNAVMLDLVVSPLLPVYMGDRLLSCLFGGVLSGMGMALVFMSGSTTGGSDIVGRLIQKKMPHISMGRALMVIDGMVLASSILVFRNIEAALFGLISLFSVTRVVDGILFGVDTGTMVTIVTTQPQEISRQITQDLHRGATILPGKGAYSGQANDVVLCAVRKPQFAHLKQIIHAADPHAFVMVTETTQVFGQGFKPMEEQA